MRYAWIVLIFLSSVEAVAAASPDSIDVAQAWQFKPDAADAGLAAGWQKPECDEGGWTQIAAGKRWEDQGFDTLDGAAWYRRWVEIPADWKGEHVWLVLGGINDSGVLFVNGEQVCAYGDRTTTSVAAVPIIAELSGRLRFGEKNLIVVQAYDWGGSGGICREPCLLTIDPAQTPLDAVFTCFPLSDKKALYVDVDAAPFGDIRPDTTLRVTVTLPNRAKPVVREKRVPKEAPVAALTVPVGRVEPGAVLHVEAAFLLSDGTPFEGVSAKHDVSWPASPSTDVKPAAGNRLNNFVSELVKPVKIRKDLAEIAFSNPRDGWVFLRTTSRRSSSPPKAFLDGCEKPILWREPGEAGTYESMRRLKNGPHRVTFEHARGVRVEVRSVPEIAYCYYPTNPHIASYGPYDWEFMRHCVLPDINTIVTRKPVDPEEFQRWIDEGGQWISNASLPGLGSPTPPACDEVYHAWATNPVMTTPGFDGLIVDEFCGGLTMHYPVWGEAVKRLHDTPAFAGKVFYAWCGDLFGEPASLAFARSLANFGYRFCWERYLQERPSEDDARKLIANTLGSRLAKWREAMPGIEKSLVVCLGYLSAPPESLNLDPSVDYHVFLDTQFQALATDPVFDGLYGVMEYMADYADEESLCYAQELFRHYCIEGRRERLNTDSYVLPHIENPDFEKGLDGWKAEPAEPGAIEAKSMKGFSWLEGRYPATSHGDQFCSMKRCAGAPNRITQTARGLKPGRLYSVKVISANLNALDTKGATPLAIDVANADILPNYGFQFVYPSSYSHEVKPYSHKHPAYMSWHRVVFRAKAREAVLAIGDSQPGAAPGSDTVFNFVELQPFHPPRRP